MNNAKSETIYSVENIITVAEKKIDAFFRGEIEKLGITQLSKEVAKSVGCSDSLSYAVLALYASYRPELASKRGPNGGFQRPAKPAEEVPMVSEPTTERTGQTC